MTSQREFLLHLIELLDQAGIPYMVAGSMSSSLHGHPRATQDADLVIDPTLEYLREWARKLGVEDMLTRLLQEAQARAEGVH